MKGKKLKKKEIVKQEAWFIKWLEKEKKADKKYQDEIREDAKFWWKYRKSVSLTENDKNVWMQGYIEGYKRIHPRY